MPLCRSRGNCKTRAPQHENTEGYLQTPRDTSLDAVPTQVRAQEISTHWHWHLETPTKQTGTTISWSIPRRRCWGLAFWTGPFLLHSCLATTDFPAGGRLVATTPQAVKVSLVHMSWRWCTLSCLTTKEYSKVATRELSFLLVGTRFHHVRKCLGHPGWAR